MDNACQAALHLIVGMDPGLTGIVALSLQVSPTAVVIASVIALPLGADIRDATLELEP